MKAINSALFLAACMAFLLSSRFASGADELSRIPKCQNAPAIDGNIDDDAWKSAFVAKLEARVCAGAMAKPLSDATEVRVLADAEYVYFGFSARESNPEGPFVYTRSAKDRGRTSATGAKVDEKVRNIGGDYLCAELYLGRYGFYDTYAFYINAEGQLYSCGPALKSMAFVEDGKAPGMRMTPSCKAITDKAKGTWHAELRVPFQDILRHPKDGIPQIIGMNFRRTQWGPDRNSGPDCSVNWTGLTDFQNKRAPLHYGHMVTWNALDIDPNYFFRAVQEPFPEFARFVKLDCGTIENPLIKGSAGKLTEFIRKEREREKFPESAQRIEWWDDLRPDKFPAIDTKVAGTARSTDGKSGFKSKPKASTAGGKCEVSFELQESDDVLVSILDEQGRLVRRLGAAMLGGSPPKPFQENTLVQRVAWDGNDESGHRAPPGNYKARVSVGLQSKYQRALSVTGQKNRTEIYDALDLDRLHAGPTVNAKVIPQHDHMSGNADILAFDRSRNEVYIPGGKSFQVFDVDGNLLRTFKLQERLPGITVCGEPTFSPGGEMYLHGWQEVWRCDREGKPLLFESLGKPFAPHFFTGHTNPHRGICAGGPDGDLYVIHHNAPHHNHMSEISQLSREGKVKQYGFIYMDTMAAGVKTDREGNVYVGSTLRPTSEPLPPALNNLPQGVRDMYRWFYGSIVKFTPAGGRVSFMTETPGPVKAPFSAARYGTSSRLIPCEVKGAVWVLPGYAPLFNKVSGTGPKCACSSPRFDLDDNGRLFIPDGVQGRINVADTNGNIIATIGKRGSKAENLEFRFPNMVVAGDDWIFVFDYLHSKVIQIKLDYEVIEEAAFKL